MSRNAYPDVTNCFQHISSCWAILRSLDLSLFDFNVSDSSENARALDSGWKKMSEAMVVHCFSRDQVVADRCYQWECEREAFPSVHGYCFNGLHSFIQNKHQTGFIQTNLRVFKNQRVIFSSGKYIQDGLHMPCYHRTTQ